MCMNFIQSNDLFLKNKKTTLNTQSVHLTVPAHHAWNFIMNYIMNSPKVLLFQFESDGM